MNCPYYIFNRDLREKLTTKHKQSKPEEDYKSLLSTNPNKNFRKTAETILGKWNLLNSIPPFG